MITSLFNSDDSRCPSYPIPITTQGILLSPPITVKAHHNAPVSCKYEIDAGKNKARADAVVLSGHNGAFVGRQSRVSWYNARGQWYLRHGENDRAV